MSVYAVIGGCGFIGKFIVSLLLESDKIISEIRVLDIKSINSIIVRENICVKYQQCDILNSTDILNQLKGVDVIIYSLSIKNTDIYTDDEILDVNVSGIRNVIEACIKNSIEFLIYTGCYESIGPNKLGDPFVGNEETEYNIQHPTTYAFSKYTAEKIVIAYNNVRLLNNNTLKTCVLRPLNVYGEGNYTLKYIYEESKKNGYRMKRISRDNIKHSRVYVGNVAWMHVLAARQIQNPNSSIPGNIYYCYDMSPCCEYDIFNLLILSQLNVTEGNKMPLWISLCILKVNKKIHKMNVLNESMLKTINSTFIVSTDKAYIDFGYMPIFTVNEAFERTSNWLRDICDN